MVALFNFQGAVYIRRGVLLRFGASFFSEVFVVALRDSLFIIAHFLSFVNPFSKFFSSFFQEVFYRTSVRSVLQNFLSSSGSYQLPFFEDRLFFSRTNLSELLT